MSRASGLVDAAARARITTSGTRQTLFVDAGAGSGKTSTLVARVRSIILDDGVPIDHLAAITFTEAAAAELRERVRASLLDARGADLLAAPRIEQALVDFDRAAITTLHGFALRVLREHPIDVGIPPRVDVLDEVQSRVAFDDRWRVRLARWQNEDAYEPIVARLWSVGIELSRPMGSSLETVALALNDNWDRLEELAPLPSRTPMRLDRRAVHAAIDAVLARRHECGASDDLMLRHLATIEPLLHDLRTADPTDDEALLVRLGARKKWSFSNGRTSNWPDLAAVKADLAALDTACNDLHGAAVADILRIWLDVLREDILAAAHERRDAGALEFHDLLVLARRLLRTSPAARRALHARYERLLLDEFQDTDPIQAELAFRIAASPEHQPADWRTLEVAEGRLFFVGDPKQSIYRFRRADIELFHDVQQHLGPEATVALTQNFRTVEPILAWVNAVFGALMPAETTSQPGYRALHATRHPSHVDAHRVTCFGEEHPDSINAGTLREHEAASVVEIATAIRADPARWPVAERDATGAEVWRPARLGDLTVLIPARTSLPQLEAALTGADVPYRVDTSTLAFDTEEVRDLLAVLRAIDSPSDDIAVVAALRTPVLACPDTALHAWIEAAGRHAVWDYRRVADDDRAAARAAAPEVSEAFAALAGWHDAARWHEVAEILERIVRERDVYAIALVRRRPRDAWRRVRFLLDQARKFADVGGGHLREFLAWADLQQREGSRTHEPLLPETDDDAVRIMTFHGAKGLEFPLVVLSGLTTLTRAAHHRLRVLWAADGTPQVAIGKKATDQFDVLADFESELDADEKLRLLYVGATRARDHLFVSTHRRAKDVLGTPRTYAALLHRTTEEHAPGAVRHWVGGAGSAGGSDVRAAVAAVEASAADHDVASPTMTVEEVERWDATRRARFAQQAAFRSVWSPTAIAAALDPAALDRASDESAGLDLAALDRAAVDAAADDRVAVDRAAVEPAPAIDRFGDLEIDLDREPDPDATIDPARAVGGTAFGRAVHAVLERVGPGVDLVALAEAAAADELADATAVETAARQVLAAPTVARALVAQHWRELEIVAPVGDVLLEGVIDLLAELDGELVLVDYKTDRTPAAELDHRVAHYAPQLAAYALAVEATTGRAVARAVLVFVGPDGVHERDVPGLATAMAAVRGHLGAGSTPS